MFVLEAYKHRITNRGINFLIGVDLFPNNEKEKFQSFKNSIKDYRNEGIIIISNAQRYMIDQFNYSRSFN